ncbi:hypothetical protein EDC56_2775 [Sinobacterium caligoides]|uniref:Beta-barrel assembly machine subunit BamE n=1 Tax=Sinobacterium caligoides TaxID=933926 RepID=A0A3N2DKC0_9GAMM|nr:hypothetical protein [Sinobacterium caligoides]ROS00139.1 hypothetical protein EDC56_2775 [Sinobacterium caligoides]
MSHKICQLALVGALALTPLMLISGCSGTPSIDTVASQQQSNAIELLLPEDDKLYYRLMTDFIQAGGEDPFPSIKMVGSPLADDITPRELAYLVSQSIVPYPDAAEVTYFEIKDGTAYVEFEMDIDGWAGVSNTQGRLTPLLELNLLQFQNINRVHRGRLPQ